MGPDAGDKSDEEKKSAPDINDLKDGMALLSGRV